MKVVCQSDNAWTDGQQIVLPSLPEPLNENLERMMVGYLDHEMAHVAFSDFGVAGHFAKEHPSFLELLNVVEDALIDRRDHLSRLFIRVHRRSLAVRWLQPVGYRLSALGCDPASASPNPEP